MINELFVPTAVVVAFTQVWMAIAARRLQWAPLDVASTSASFRNAIDGRTTRAGGVRSSEPGSADPRMRWLVPDVTQGATCGRSR